MGRISKVQIRLIHSFIHSLNPYSLPLEMAVRVGEGANEKTSTDNAIPNHHGFSKTAWGVKPGLHSSCAQHSCASPTTPGEKEPKVEI